MKLEITTAVLAGTLALAAPAAFAGDGGTGTAEAFAPNGEDYPHDLPTPRAKPQTVEHVIKKSRGVAKPGANGAVRAVSQERSVKVGARKEIP
jgi:hypothetical protein